jgi:hypothetical protein
VPASTMCSTSASNPPSALPPLPIVHNGATVPEPECVIKARLAHGVRQVLVRWKDESAASTTWEDLDSFTAHFPAFQLEDELTLDGGEMSCTGARIRDGAGPETSGALPNTPNAPRACSATRRPCLVAKIRQ